MSLPKQLKSARMTNATVGDTIDTNVGDLEQALADILGIVIDSDVTASPFSLDNGGRMTKQTIAQRAAGPVGWRIRDTVANREVRLAVDAGTFRIDENTGTEGTPVWTLRFEMDISSGEISSALVTSSHMGLAPQGDGNNLHYLDGTGAYSTPSAVSTPAARVTQVSSTTLSSGTEAVIPMASETFDTDTMHSTVTNTSRLTAITSGKYLIMGQATFASNSIGYRRLRILLNGATAIGEFRAAPVPGNSVTFQVRALYSLAAGEYVELAAFQNCLTTLNASSCWLAAYKIG